MRTPKETFIQELEHIEVQLRKIADSYQLRKLVNDAYYRPNFTIGVAIQAVIELADAYEENAGYFRIQPGQPLKFQEFEQYSENP